MFGKFNNRCTKTDLLTQNINRIAKDKSLTIETKNAMLNQILDTVYIMLADETMYRQWTSSYTSFTFNQHDNQSQFLPEYIAYAENGFIPVK